MLQLAHSLFSGSSVGPHAPRIQSTLDQPPGPAQMQQFWSEPSDITSRDLFLGRGGQTVCAEFRRDFLIRRGKAGWLQPRL